MATAPLPADDGAQDGGVITPPANDGGEPTQLSDVEQLAHKMGWRPRDEYTGAESKWKPAEDYVLAEQDIKRGLRDTVKGLKETVDRMAATHTRQTERALKQQAEEINARFAKAVEDRDPKAAAAATQEMRELERETAPESKGADADFARDNPWYGQHDEATAYAWGISRREATKGASVAAQLKAASEGVRKRFPELFEERKESKPQPGVNAPGSRAVGTPRAKTFADMPPEAKKAGRDYAQLFHQRFKIPVEQSEKEYAVDYWANKGDA